MFLAYPSQPSDYFPTPPAPTSSQNFESEWEGNHLGRSPQHTPIIRPYRGGRRQGTPMSAYLHRHVRYNLRPGHPMHLAPPLSSLSQSDHHLLNQQWLYNVGSLMRFSNVSSISIAPDYSCTYQQDSNAIYDAMLLLTSGPHAPSTEPFCQIIPGVLNVLQAQ
jgi:hypothetical protein